MKKILSIAIICAVAMGVNAVPAKRGWQTRTQADGTTIELQQMGDEFYHYMINRDGQRVRLNESGMYEVVGEAPTQAQVRARRAEGQVRRQRKDFGKTPNLAPKGVVILVNFSDKSMASGHTHDTFDELCNSENCTVNSGYPSAAEYFKSQSGGAYHPQFDVFGPVTLSKSYSYYGNNVGSGDDAEDEFATDAVIEACILANKQYPELNFADYDSDKNGDVDFVYVIYAGYGEADGGGDNTIWPHNWSIQELVDGDKYYNQGYTKYRQSQTKLDGVYLDNYAMSNELDHYNNSLCGIGTLCHEFGHVMGLPDFYDTNYGTNYSSALTPNDWDVMDGGAYNEDGHCPPNYSPWEKYFFGWHTPVNLGNNGKAIQLTANGNKGYQAYQINTSGKQQTATTSGECYYIENRQQIGWDKGLPHHGMLIWKVNYNASSWENNTPNNTANKPLYTIVSASGSTIGTHANSAGTSYVYDGPKNAFPGSKNVTSWKGLSGKPLLDITEKNGVISLVYIEDGGYNVKWVVNGVELEQTEYEEGDALVMPTKTVTPCEGTKFIGWTEEENWLDPFVEPADLFTSAEGKKVTRAVTYYAVFQ